MVLPLERIYFGDMRGDPGLHYTLNLHLQAYVFAHRFIHKKSVLDAACGTCFGTMIFSTACKKIIGVDKDKEAIQYGKDRLTFCCPSKFLVKDLNEDELPKTDVCVSIETIEHLRPDNKFLKKLKADELIFTVPLNMPGVFHLVSYESPQQFDTYLKKCGWEPKEQLIGENHMLLGRAVRA